MPSWEDHVATTVIRFVISTITVAGNVTVASVIFGSKNLRKSTCNLLIGLLSSLDIFIGVSQYARASYAIWWTANGSLPEHSRLACVLASMPSLFGLAGGQIVIFLIAVDRFIGAYAPVAYKPLMRRTRSTAFAVAATASVSSGGLLSFFALYKLEPALPIPVCSIGPAVAQAWISVWSWHNVVFGCMITGLYVACLVRLRYHYRQFSLTRNELHALKHQDRIFMSVSVIIVLYIVFHAVPNVATVVMN
ncbi:hypothetical protein AAVH_32742, partial [Aphelenchoides avenae]